VSGPRIGAELRLLAREPDSVEAFGTLGELGLDAAIEPGLRLAEPELARRALALLPADGRPALVALAVAARGVEKPQELLDRLGFEAGDRDAIAAAARDADGLADRLRAARLPSEIAAAVANAGIEQVALAGALGASEAAGQWLGRLRHVRLEIDGRDLLEAGVPEGPEIGRGLRAALDAKLDGRVTGRSQELDTAVGAARDARGGA
jgi:tRNA nucleotidyltransferase (CCA-adding enzyme)